MVVIRRSAQVAYNWRVGASQPSRFNGLFFSILYLYILGTGRHDTVMFYVILNKHTNFIKAAQNSTFSEAWLFGCS